MTSATNNQSLSGFPRLLWNAMALTLILTLITGAFYPLVVTGLSQLLFRHQANGSLVDKNGKPTNDDSQAVGSALIGQWFDQPQYFWPRPSGTSVTNSSPSVGLPYNAGQSGGTNLSPANDVWVSGVKSAADTLRTADPGNSRPIPIDLVTASGSGLDPHISVDAANYQVSRILACRKNITAAQLQQLIADNSEERSLGILGEKTVNVLQLNLALDNVAPYTPPATAPAAASQPATGPATP